jgi:Aspartyl protease
LLLVPAVGSAAPDDEPTGLVPTGTSLAKVRALYDHAYPRDHTRNATIIEDWRLFQDGIVGSYHVNRLGRDVRTTTTLGPFSYARGVLHGVHWEETRNGVVFTYSGLHEQRDAVSDRALRDTLDDRDVRVLGESVPLDAYVVEVNPPGGRHEWYYVEKHSGYLVRRELVQRRRRFVTSYDDYHVVDGLPEPSRVRTVDSLGNEREQILVNRTLDDTPDARDVEMPAGRRVVEFPDKPSAIRLPARFVNGLAIVRVIVGRGAYDFLLDSGAAGIVVDPAIVEQQDFEQYGRRLGATMGTFPESTAIVPQMTIGPLRMRNVVARVVPVPFHPDARTHIMGLLGFDFFAEGVVHFDQHRGLVEAINPDTFKPPNESTSVQLALDDKTASVRAHAAGALARVVIDTGSNRSVFESAFADRADLALASTVTLQRLRGIGGYTDASTARISVLDVGGLQTRDATVEVVNADLGAEDLDGIVGTDLLRPYEIWLDYPSSTLYLRRVKH